MVEKIIIRKATKEDAGIIYEFVNELEDTVFDNELFHQYYEENLRSVKNHYLVALIDSTVVGFLSCHGQVLLHHSGLVYEIQELFVDKHYRNKGIGRKLISGLQAILLKDDYKSLEVACSFKRKDTHRFYIANGFAQTHYKFTREKM
jgi:PhnO protein